MTLLATRLYALTYLIISGLVIFLNQRLNFDIHHDGLIVSNFLEIRRSIQNEGPWPFNQYGVTWIIPYLPVILTGEENSIYERANLISLLIFLLVALISFATARKFLSINRAIFVPIFLALTTSLGSLRTWPSVSAMLYLSLFLLATTIYFSEGESNGILRCASSFMGLLTPMIILSRVQVGIFLLISFSIAVFKFGMNGTRKYFYLTMITTTVFLALYLANKNWLSSVTSDTFVYSLNYLTSEKTRVVPIFTLIGSLVVLLIFTLLLGKRFSINFGRILTISVGVFLCIFLLLYIKAIVTKGPSAITTPVILMRRLFVSLLIGTFLFYVSDLARSVVERRKNLSGSLDRRIIAVVLVAAASLLELVPLFDSTHGWWASPPLVILLILLINKVLIKYFNFCWSKNFQKTISLILLSSLILSAHLFLLEKRQLQSFGPKFISGALGSGPEVVAQVQLSRLVSNEAPAYSKILNLCVNSNVFLMSNYYQSASRFYISWPNMRGYLNYTNNISALRPDFILTCSDLPYPAAGALTDSDRKELRKSQDEILKELFPQPVLNGKIITAEDIEWELWSNNR